ncbi:hypothetical protein F2Q69_00036546 [Brassica cretica]|uniref:Uncharacterized protein n=1 Tax=Brassica cretica TaxID=69181 RepID=A0A8S9SR53_BRACR|nr:hypothetical protein F2Q69_00036546 [Brassica cretica]
MKILWMRSYVQGFVDEDSAATSTNHHHCIHTHVFHHRLHNHHRLHCGIHRFFHHALHRHRHHFHGTEPRERGSISQDAKVRVWTEKTESSIFFKKRDLTFHLELICESPEAVKNSVSRSRNRDRDVDFDFGEKFGEKEDVKIQVERRSLQKRKGFIVRSCSSIRQARSPRLRTYLKTSIDEGVDEDFRKIRMSNSNIKEAIGDVAEGIEFLF